MCGRRLVSSLFYQLSHNLHQISEQQKTLSWILLKQNKTVSTLSEIRERAQERENGKQARKQTRNDSFRSRRQQESAEQMEQWRQARNDSLRSRRQQENAKQLEQRRQTRRESDRQCRQRQRLAQTDSHRQPLLIEFKSDLLTPLSPCHV